MSTFSRFQRPLQVPIEEAAEDDLSLMSPERLPHPAMVPSAGLTGSALNSVIGDFWWPWEWLGACEGNPCRAKGTASVDVPAATPAAVIAKIADSLKSAAYQDAKDQLDGQCPAGCRCLITRTTYDWKAKIRMPRLQPVPLPTGRMGAIVITPPTTITATCDVAGRCVKKV